MNATGSSFNLMDASQVRRIAIFFFAADLFLLCAYLVFFLHGNPVGNDSPGLFDLDLEGNLPSWYSSMKLLSVGLCAFFYGRLIYLSDRLAGALILICAVVFAYLSMDEGSAIHERIGDKLDLLLTGGVGAAGTAFKITGTWMLFLAPPLFAALIAGVIFLRKRLSIPTGVFVKAVLGIVIFIVSAGPEDIILNYVSGAGATFQVAVEEYGEMMGVTLILWAVMTLLARQNAAVVSGAAAPAREPAHAVASSPRRGGRPAFHPAPARRQST